VSVKSVKLLVVFIAVAVAVYVAARSQRGVEFRTHYELNRACCDLSMTQAAALAGRQVLGLAPAFPSEIGQDKWVLAKMFPSVTDGFFLDVGSGHGTIGSNTKALEARGWSGICVDPFPTHMEGRTCQTFTDVVSSTAGQVVRFHTHSGLGGIADTLGKWKDEAQKSPAVEMTTTTLGDILNRAKAPPFIHFLSLDIEGAELEALRGIDLDTYRFGAMAIEHNEEEPKRTDIINYLRQHGYQRVHTYRQDDFFAPVSR
jgi:FkbM family methyltransferase